MSKAIKLLISIIVTLFCNMPPVDAQQAFYVYRSDGVINTFISSEIDSMTYSCIDLDSIQQNEYVTLLPLHLETSLNELVNRC